MTDNKLIPSCKLPKRYLYYKCKFVSFDGIFVDVSFLSSLKISRSYSYYISLGHISILYGLSRGLTVEQRKRIPQDRNITDLNSWLFGEY